ncbi:MAG: hypothetical protein IPN95_02205 [Bacteroidetes bacterium]|nr:hypothetical protein [Bacteroidota bacterium]MBP6721436.1 hypothetical protein [Bacteroidia bacterium]
MSKEEVRHFKLFASRTQVEADRKDLALFDYIRKSGEDYNEGEIFAKLYEGDDKNSFYRLKNRLMQDMNKSLNLQHMEDDEVVYLFHLLSLGRFFHSRQKYKVAIHFLRKAEKKAIKLEQFELLDLLYSEMIKLSLEMVAINPEEYIRKRKENHQKLQALRDIDDILAAVVHRVRSSPKLSASQTPLFDLLEKTVNEFSQNPKLKGDSKLRFTIYHAVSRILLARKEYLVLETYLLQTYDEFAKESLFNRSNHDTKLQMLVYLVNTLYKNRKLEQSLQYAEFLRQGMEEFHGLLYQKYLTYYYNALIINYSILDVSKSTQILEEVIGNHTFRDTPYNEFLMMLNLAICYFRTKKITKALKALVQAFIHDGYHAASQEFKLKLAIFELTLRQESGDFEVMERRIGEVKRDYHEILDKPTVVTENKLLYILGEMNKSMAIRADKPLIENIKQFLVSTPKPELEDFSFIDYHEWLSNKIGLI